MRPLCCLLYSMMLLSLFSSCKKEPFTLPGTVALLSNGQYSTANFRIPAAVVTNTGAVLLACDARLNSNADLPNKINTVLRRSTDNGSSWSQPATIMSGAGQSGFSDPSFIIDRQTGKIFLFANYGADGVGIKSSQPGFGSNTIHTMVCTSTDDGLSWSAPRDITPQVKEQAWSAMMASPGHGIQLRNGVLAHGAYYLKNGVSYAYVFYSTDHGDTWQKSKCASSLAGENVIAELRDSAILMNMRNYSGKGVRTCTYSHNLGETWSNVEYQTALPDPVCNAGITRMTNNLYDIDTPLLFTNAANSRSRKNLVLRLSDDDGKTWRSSLTIDDGSCAYSDVVFLNDGTIGVFYEKGNPADPSQCIMFAKVPVSMLQ